MQKKHVMHVVLPSLLQSTTKVFAVVALLDPSFFHTVVLGLEKT